MRATLNPFDILDGTDDRVFFYLDSLARKVLKKGGPKICEPPAHVWEKQELSFTAVSAFANPYTDVVMWVDLSGPGFQKRIYGFWDSDRSFRVRLVATAPGTWTWRLFSVRRAKAPCAQM